MLHSRIEGSGKPLLILHGFLGMSDNWKTLGSQYAALGYEVHMPDMRNHGRSPHSDDFTYKAMVGDLLEYCDAKGLQQVDVIGHSMGGKAAMFFAMSHPDRVKKLIVADIAPRYYNPHHDDILDGLNAVDFAAKPDRDAVNETLSEYVKDEGTRQFLMKSLYWQSPGQLAFRFNLPVFTKQRDNIGEPIPENAVFDKPTLFLKGENSGYINDRDAEAIKRQFPKSDIVTIRNAGHWLHAENPADFFKESSQFLNS
jgi:esterase